MRSLLQSKTFRHILFKLKHESATVSRPHRIGPLLGAAQP
jgi:hypothetical protein